MDIIKGESGWDTLTGERGGRVIWKEKEESKRH